MSRPGTENRRWRRAIGRRGPILALGCLTAVGLVACGQEQRPAIGADVAVAPTSATTTTQPTTTTTTTTIDFDRLVTQGTAPLGDDVGPTDVAAVVIDVRGQTAGFSAQVGRLAPFIDLTIAPVAQITGLDVVLAPEVEDRSLATATVRFRVPDGGPEMIKAIADEFNGLAWNPMGQTTTEVDGATVTEMAFRKPGFSPDELELLTTVRAGTGPTAVEMTYFVAAEADEVEDEDGVTFFERLSAWQSGLGFARVADLTEVGVETTDESGAVFARYRLDAENEGEAVEILARATTSGDYELLGATAEEPPSAGPLRLVGDEGALIIVELSPGPEDGVFAVEATYGFELDPLD